MEKNEDFEMSNVIKTKKTRQRKCNTSSMTAKSRERKMSKLKSDESDSVEGSPSEGMFSMAEPAARFLLRALQELHLADNTITVKDLQPFAEQVRTEMALMIGNEEFLRELFDVIDQLNFHDRQAHYKTVDHLSEKITQSQINLAKNDRDFPF